MLIPTAYAGDGIFGILQGSYGDAIEDLPASYPTVPDKNMQQSGNIQAWIDIVGFRQMIRDNGIDYVPGNPVDFSIVQYDAWANLDCDGCSVDSLTKSLSVNTQDDMTIATLDVVLKWSQTTCSSSEDDETSDIIYTESYKTTKSETIFRLDDTDSDDNGDGDSDDSSSDCSTSYYSESATFQDMEISPHIYNISISNLPVIITEYNNTISPKVSIKIPAQPGAIKTVMQYRNSTAKHYYGIGFVEWSGKNVPFLNITKSDFWNVTGMSRIGNNVLINGTTINYNELNISMSTPYADRVLDNYSIVKLDYSAEQTWNPGFFVVVGTVAILGWGINKLKKMII